MTIDRSLRRWICFVLVCAAAVASTAGCGSNPPATTRPPATRHATRAASRPALRSGHVTVSIAGYAFAPARIVVAAGSRVTFVNHDSTPHTATTIGAGFDSGTLRPHARRTLTLSAPGTYPYRCQFHPFMHGVVVVRGR